MALRGLMQQWGSDPPPANVRSTAAPPMAAIPEKTVAATSSSNARSQNAADGNAKCPPECTHLMRETLYPHKLSRNGSVNREVSNALSRMDCGGDVRKAWNDLDKYVTLEDTEEMTKIENNAKAMARILRDAQVQLAEAVFKREWSEEMPYSLTADAWNSKWWIVRMPI